MKQQVYRGAGGACLLTKCRLKVEMCMGMGKTGIQWVPWDSHGNGNKISHVMGMGMKCMGMGIKT